MPELRSNEALPIAMPLLLSGRDVMRKPFLERTCSSSIYRTGLKALTKQNLAIGEAVQVVVLGREYQARVNWVSKPRGESREVNLDIDQSSDASWALLFATAQWMQNPSAEVEAPPPASSAAPAPAGGADKLASTIAEMVQAELVAAMQEAAVEFERRAEEIIARHQQQATDARVLEMENRIAEQEVHFARQSQKLMRETLATASDCEAKLTENFRERLKEVDGRVEELEQRLRKAVDARLEDFESRLAAAADRAWQDLGRRFTNAGVAYEKHIHEVGDARLAEFEQRVAAAIEKVWQEFGKRIAGKAE
jgi:Skp family chaperone for outer membrane proteins